MSVGIPIDRVDGRSKVLGRAVYTSDHRFSHMAYAVPVCSVISSGELTGLDSGAARRMPGVVDILHHGNARRLIAIPQGEASPMIDERRPPLSDTTIRYFGQYVALVIAETLETATAAAARVRRYIVPARRPVFRKRRRRSRASAATSTEHSRLHRYESMRRTARRPKRIIRSSCTHPLQYGTAIRLRCTRRLRPWTTTGRRSR